MHLNLLLSRIKDEAHERRKSGATEDDAWLHAIVAVIREFAERPAVSAIQENIACFVHERTRHNPIPVTTTQIAANVSMIGSINQAWYHSRQLERAGWLYKPGGRYSQAGLLLTDYGQERVEELNGTQGTQLHILSA